MVVKFWRETAAFDPPLYWSRYVIAISFLILVSSNANFQVKAWNFYLWISYARLTILSILWAASNLIFHLIWIENAGFWCDGWAKQLFKFAVYEGTKSFYKEEDETLPVNVYGKSKVEAEKLISSQYSNYAILRSSIIVGPQSVAQFPKSLPIQVCNAHQQNTWLAKAVNCWAQCMNPDCLNALIIYLYLLWICCSGWMKSSPRDRLWTFSKMNLGALCMSRMLSPLFLVWLGNGYLVCVYVSCKMFKF